MTSSDLFISWQDVHRDAQRLAQALKTQDWAGIVAVTRGGMVPACLIALELDIPIVETFCVNSYDGQTQTADARVFKCPDLPGGGAGWLVVDDLVDSGRTFALIRKRLPAATYACLYAKPDGAAQADVSLKPVPQGVWVHFPWEPLAGSGAARGK